MWQLVARVLGEFSIQEKGNFCGKAKGGPSSSHSCLADGPQVQTLLILDGRPRPLKWRGAPPKNWYVHEPSHELQIRNLQRSLNSEFRHRRHARSLTPRRARSCARAARSSGGHTTSTITHTCRPIFWCAIKRRRDDSAAPRLCSRVAARARAKRPGQPYRRGGCSSGAPSATQM